MDTWEIVTVVWMFVIIGAQWWLDRQERRRAKRMQAVKMVDLTNRGPII